MCYQKSQTMNTMNNSNPLPTTSEIFQKHFGKESASVGIFHPNVESFFDELNQVCIEEDKRKNAMQIDIIDYKSDYEIDYDLCGTRINYTIVWAAFHADNQEFRLTLFPKDAVSILHEMGEIEIGKFIGEQVEVFGGWDDPMSREYTEKKSIVYIDDLLKDLIDTELLEKMIRFIEKSEAYQNCITKIG